jgi:ATP-dependent Clp protease ATP-binding subunit ClpA
MDHHRRARAGSPRLVLWSGGRVLLGDARWRAMFERFTDRARHVVVLAQDEARRLDHNYIGTEHILLGLIHEGQGVAARALESLGVNLAAVRQQVEEIIGRGLATQAVTSAVARASAVTAGTHAGRQVQHPFRRLKVERTLKRADVLGMPDLDELTAARPEDLLAAHRDRPERRRKPRSRASARAPIRGGSTERFG